MMHAKVFGVIAVYLACLLGMALAAGGDVIDDVILPLHHHHGHGFIHPHAGPIKHDVQLQERKVPQPPNGPTYRCHDPHPDIFGPAPPVEDCDNVIKQFAALPTDINVKLVEGCYQIVSGNCTGLVCPQRLGESTISGALAAKFMASPLREECVAKGRRGWWIDGQGLGIGVYLT
ncbi:hypothetical protein EV127DRAFT_403480 [Xylaria flabelliformis]|nr:hypothetical protein EV127DRAFT_403480 [Xylaria flabelliformis]